ncbi:hypothetical protein [Desulfovibrio oxyclinae]|uniref:hypothetical protein n=1 Tax=Desulfovibrio oxyclinae TaxID=63560 RepID=UPI0003811342|nr:hypothetical protein [Desulfovibrio oxyclinae]
MNKILFRECPKCHGYGVLDSGRNCTFCGGAGHGGLHGDGVIGSGEIMIDKDSGRRITPSELARSIRAKRREKTP